MIDVKKIVKEASATGTCFAPQYHEQRIARHAVALTLRAVAEECRRRQVEQTQLCIDNPTLTGKCVRCGRSESYGDFAADLCKLANGKGQSNGNPS